MAALVNGRLRWTD